MGEVYWEKTNTVLIPPPFLGGITFSPKFWKGIRKEWVPGGTYKVHSTNISLTVLLVKKYCKIKYGFQDSTSSGDLSAAANQPINV